ncbi:hypothetical protein UFOVP1516_41 [uncultured Caudovirales phage]|uniref:Uncharacterized protein n=1 Tax=uncultured Caudovirales phage TaxID=2100421 RepID=A0A6J7X836_9CAUD|nr:hypothetical protein UFOVP887_3 [uncultured Caudovirales phage]CAB5226848.1 hypothetical protein UFOVP1516_41 [uncultured Caudovirales phage]
MQSNKAYLSPERTKYIRGLTQYLSTVKVNGKEYLSTNNLINKFWVEEIMRKEA